MQKSCEGEDTPHTCNFSFADSTCLQPNSGNTNLCDPLAFPPYSPNLFLMKHHDSVRTSGLYSLEFCPWYRVLGLCPTPSAHPAEYGSWAGRWAGSSPTQTLSGTQPQESPATAPAGTGGKSCHVAQQCGHVARFRDASIHKTQNGI